MLGKIRNRNRNMYVRFSKKNIVFLLLYLFAKKMKSADLLFEIEIEINNKKTSKLAKAEILLVLFLKIIYES
jgi:hypothetical protein